MVPLRLIVGLGNPGAAYAVTRHNIGAEFVRQLAERFSLPLVRSRQFKGQLARGPMAGLDMRLLLPGVYMNQSGQVVGPYVRYYKIKPEQMIVVHDEVAFQPGVVRLKSGGGANGHNGLKSLIGALACRNFHRLRIGVGHPGDKEQMVRYLTETSMPVEDRQLAMAALAFEDGLLQALVHGEWRMAMNHLHGPAPGASPC